MGMGLLVVAVLGLLWVLHRQEMEDHRDALVRDILWVEQRIGSGLVRDVDVLRDLTLDLRGGEVNHDKFDEHATALLRSSPGLVEIALVDLRGTLLAKAPVRTDGRAAAVEPVSQAAYRSALSTGKPTYSPSHPSLRGHEFEVFIPYNLNGVIGGVVVGVYSLGDMLSDTVPWWLAEKHRVTLRSGDGAVLAAKSSVEAAGRPDLTREVRLDPPGHGLVLHVESYGAGTRVLRNLLAISIVSLAGTVLWTLWSLRRHVHRRMEAERALREQGEKLATTARLATLGEMASSLAHELNGPLAAIASYSAGSLNLLEAGTASPSDLRETIEKTAQQAQRAGRIIRRVRDFVRKSEPTRQPMALDPVIEEAVGFAAPDAVARKVRIAWRPGTAGRTVLGDPLLLQQVLLNLVRNGMEAMASTPPEERELVVATSADRRTATVRVTDSGCGIAPGTEGQLFDAFFTTKPEGTGMGLNICRSVVEAHGGRIWAEPSAGRGTAFNFSLPLEEP